MFNLIIWVNGQNILIDWREHIISKEMQDVDNSEVWKDWAVVLTGSSDQSRERHDLPAVCLVSVFMQRHRVVTRCKLSSVNFSWRSYLTCQRAFVDYLSPFLMTYILAFLKFLLFYPSHIILSFVHRQECYSSWPTAERCSCWAPTQLQLLSQWCKTLVWLLWLQAR